MGVIQIMTDAKTITWITREGIQKALIEHWAKDGDMDGVKSRVESAYEKNGYVKLIDGTKAYKLTHPYSDLLTKSIDIIINELKPDIWNEDHENDFPDFLRVPRFGIFDWQRLKTVSEKFGLKSIIRCKDEQIIE